MRVGIREQLALLGLALVVFALAVVSIPTWIVVHGFVRGIKAQDLAQAASLKATSLTSHLDFLQSTCTSIATRLLIQRALASYTRGNSTQEQLSIAAQTLRTGLITSGFIDLLQGRIFAPNATGHLNVVFSETEEDTGGIQMPYTSPNGSALYFGDPDGGFPPMLYPNLTYTSTAHDSVSAFQGVDVTPDQFLLLGPLMINSSLAFFSLSQPILDVGNRSRILGYLTVIASATSILKLLSAPEGLGDSGETLLIGPDTPWNRFSDSNPISNATTKANPSQLGTARARFVLPPVSLDNQETRHTPSDPTSVDQQSFLLSSFPIVLHSYAGHVNSVNNASGNLDAVNEKGIKVSVGYARAKTPLVDWMLVVEQSQNEAYGPTDTLRTILLSSIFGTVGVVLLFMLPCAHFSVRPIRRLRTATQQSINPPGYDDSDLDQQHQTDGGPAVSQPSEKGLTALFKHVVLRRPSAAQKHEGAPRHRIFRIPGAVKNRKHFITDELTDLTSTFNEMSDELYAQYTQLEEKVAERTKELEISKKAAEAADESKTLFIANMSHELKTPLNGILGMCAVCMEDDDMSRIKSSLKTAYESGNLLLRLLEDLLNFSRNQVGQQMTLEEEEFQLEDVGKQLKALFQSMASERRIGFSVNYGEQIPPSESSVSKRALQKERSDPNWLKDLHVLGDQHRILQIILNLVGNSLKFTPEGGNVNLRIKCLGVAQPPTVNTPLALSRIETQRRYRLGTDTPSDPGTLTSNMPAKPQRKGSVPVVRVYPVPLSDFGSRGTNTPEAPKNSSRPASASPADVYLFEFAVEDTGQGIPETMHTRVFEPFVQVDLGLSKKFGGAGLGLTISKQLANLMGGSITLTSTPGTGTTVYLHVPLKIAASHEVLKRLSVSPTEDINGHIAIDKSLRQSLEIGSDSTGPAIVKNPVKEHIAISLNGDSATNAESGAPVGINIEDMRVLVADDNAVNVEVVMRMLRLEKVTNIIVARDGQEAYDIVKEDLEGNRQFNLIFMDIQMPRLDGLQSTRLIRELGFSGRIVALTASSEKTIVEKGMDCGMDEFMSKPIRRPALKQVLSQYGVTPGAKENQKT